MLENKIMQIKPHNRDAYKRVRDSFERGNRTCAVEPTGCGKSYVALQLIKDFSKKRILYVTSYKAALNHFLDLAKKE